MKGKEKYRSNNVVTIRLGGEWSQPSFSRRLKLKLKFYNARVIIELTGIAQYYTNIFVTMDITPSY